MRFFFERFLIAQYKALADHENSIAIGVASHLALGTEAERRAWGIALDGFSFSIANDEAMTASALSGRIARVHPAGEDTHVIRVILRIFENTPLHPKCSFDVSPMAILALLRLEVPQVFKHEDGSPLLCGELDNASAHQMGDLLISVADLAPEVGIVLFVLCNDASLRSVACNPA